MVQRNTLPAPINRTVSARSLPDFSSPLREPARFVRNKRLSMPAVNQGNKLATCIPVVEQWNTLTQVLNGFPKSVLKKLFVYEKGNGVAVCSFLMARGWSVHDKELMDYLEDKEDPLFHNKYYFGTWKSEYENLLLSEGDGSFLLCYSTQKQIFQVYYCLDGTVKITDLTAAPTFQLRENYLRNPVRRPCNLEFNDLLPFANI